MLVETSCVSYVSKLFPNRYFMLWCVLLVPCADAYSSSSVCAGESKKLTLHNTLRFFSYFGTFYVSSPM